MSSSEEDENIPDVEICQSRCEEFAVVTNTDTACAQFYLQDRDWDLQRSLNAFFEDRQNKGALRVIDGSKSEVVVVVDGSQKSLAAAATAVIGEAAITKVFQQQSTSSGSKTSKNASNNAPVVFNELSLISWNIDGLDEKNQKLRTKAVSEHIKREAADIVFLQEVVVSTAEYLMKHLPEYKCILGNEFGYFSATFLKKNIIKYEYHDIIDFPSTRMMRNLVKIYAKVGDIPLCLINAHLESTAEASDERTDQLKTAFKTILKLPAERTVIFGGDLNLRDKELEAAGGLPAGVEDMWKACGSRKECSYTWDLTRNDNLIWNGRFKPRCRFDRVYLRGSSPSKVTPKHFGLIGLERLLPHRCFPSDHWGIICKFNIDA